MKKPIQIATLAAMSFAFLSLCGGGSEESTAQSDGGAGHEHHMQNITKVVKQDGVQVAFDVMTADSHAKMTKQMGIDHQHTPGTDHHLSVTLMDLEQSAVIQDAQVQAITVIGPDGAKTSDAGAVLTGGGMHHHGLDFKMSGAGEYTARIKFIWRSEAYSFETEFEM